MSRAQGIDFSSSGIHKMPIFAAQLEARRGVLRAVLPVALGLLGALGLDKEGAVLATWAGHVFIPGSTSCVSEARSNRQQEPGWFFNLVSFPRQCGRALVVSDKTKFHFFLGT